MSKQYDQYVNVSYSGRELLKKHSLEETGLWKIRGEDPNCDFGGHHYQPELGIVEGRLVDVINYAVQVNYRSPEGHAASCFTDTSRCQSYAWQS